MNSAELADLLMTSFPPTDDAHELLPAVLRALARGTPVLR